MRVAIKSEVNRKRAALMRGGDLALLNEASSDSVIMSGFLYIAEQHQRHRQCAIKSADYRE